MSKKILITGGSGLVGSHLVTALLNNEAYELCLVGRGENTAWAANNKASIIKIDFATDWDVNQLPTDLHAIIHLSQAENFRDFPAKAKETFYINTLSTLKLADHAIKNKINHFIYASSGGVYGMDGMYDEAFEAAYKKEMGFYIGTKHCSEIILDNYQDLLNVIMLRFFFVYGKGQSRGMLIPRLIDSVKDGKPLKLQGDVGLKINPVHASDAAKAIIATLSLKGSHKINVAGAEVLSLREIGEIIGIELGINPQFEADEKQTSKSLIGDISKMKKLLVAPLVKFKDGIKSLI